MKRSPSLDSPQGSTGELIPPVFDNGTARLRPVNSGDYGYLRDLELGAEIGTRWRLRGATPGPEQWARGFEAPLAQMIVTESSSGRPVGLVSLHDANFQDGFGSVAATKFSLNDRSLVLMNGLLLFLDHAFANWNFRKLYFDVPEYNLRQFGSVLRDALRQEARLREHNYVAGRYWDRFTLSLFREDWDELRIRLSSLLEVTS